MERNRSLGDSQSLFDLLWNAQNSWSVLENDEKLYHYCSVASIMLCTTAASFIAHCSKNAQLSFAIFTIFAWQTSQTHICARIKYGKIKKTYWHPLQYIENNSEITPYHVRNKTWTTKGLQNCSKYVICSITDRKLSNLNCFYWFLLFIHIVLFGMSNLMHHLILNQYEKCNRTQWKQYFHIYTIYGPIRNRTFLCDEFRRRKIFILKIDQPKNTIRVQMDLQFMET